MNKGMALPVPVLTVNPYKVKCVWKKTTVMAGLQRPGGTGLCFHRF